jgi:hypothetical protein
MQGSDSSPKILIAGAAWRVWRFIVPALKAAGLSVDDIVIMRRNADADLHPVLAGIRVVASLDEIASETFDITLNCAVASAMLSVQQAMVNRYPKARHFCDTPIFSDTADLRSVLRLALRRLNSLEDWPLMPNLAFFVREMRAAGRGSQLRIESFGIPTHFLSLYRSIHGDWALPRQQLHRDQTRIVGRLARGRDVVFWYRKDLPAAKVSFRSESALIEDFHEVEPGPHEDAGVVYRVVGDGEVTYYHGRDAFFSIDIDPAWIASFAPFSDRKNVHEFDKFVGLVSLFRSILARGKIRPYGYLASVRDNLTHLKLTSQGRCKLL